MEDRLHIAEHEYAFHIPQAAPIRYSPKHQTIDPYVLGVWIGDGTSTKAEVASVDAPILRELEHAGYAVRPATAPLAYRVGGTGRRGTATAVTPATAAAELRNRRRRRHPPIRALSGAALSRAMDPLRRSGASHLTEIRRTDSVPVRCIQVASPRGLYLGHPLLHPDPQLVAWPPRADRARHGRVL